MTRANVALKIAHQCSSSSGLSHEYDVYTDVAGSEGISQALWYGKEDVYEVLVLDNLGTSLDDLVGQPKFDRRMVFSYATQMVCLLYEYETKRPY